MTRIPSKEELDQAKDSRFSPEIHRKLKEASVGIAGLGGLGSHIAVMLARCGIGHLHLIDFDRVDLANLNRQQYFMRHVGQYKTEALKEQLLDINPYLDIRTDCVRVCDENIRELFVEDDIVCEAFDVPENKAMLVNGVLEQFPGKIIVSASGMAGYGNSNAIRTRKITGRFYLCGDGTSDSGSGLGLMSPRVGICAGHEANLIAKLLIDGAADEI